ncbi:MAG: SusC/RagA family TonB-linked outer membrane protein [Chitinophagaceae bacterium]
MQKTALRTPPAWPWRRYAAKTLFVMKLTFLFLTAAFLNVSAKGISQGVTISARNVPLQNVFTQIEKQTGYTFFYKSDLLEKGSPVTLELKNVSLAAALEACFKTQPFTYSLEGKIIVLKPKPAATGTNDPAAMPEKQTVSGIVQSDEGVLLAGATVSLRHTHISVVTDAEGRFSLQAGAGDVLVITYVGYAAREITITTGNISAPFLVRLSRKNSVLDETVVIAYGTTTRRLNTGSVTTVKAEDIEKQPVANPLAALAGLVPGMMVTQTSGVPGASVDILIRGQNSIAQGSAPLFLIDGVPYPNTYLGSGNLEMGNGGQSPFANINPQDIQSIEVLKDADATAIYGSRGANGVILITTKKGSSKTTKVDAAFYTGAGSITRRLKLLNTPQYVAMRTEAFSNDARPITAATAPDLVLWDTTRYTDWQDYFIGGTARFTNANATLSGGNANTHFLLGASYNRQTTVFPGDFLETRGSVHANMNHSSDNKKFQLSFSGSYSTDNNRLPVDLTSSIDLAPNNPALQDADGKLVWTENGGDFVNPLSNVLRRSTAVTDNFRANLNLSYQLPAGLSLRLTAGYNYIQFNEKYLQPVASLDPNNAVSLISSSSFEYTTAKGWIIEPQLQYSKSIGRHRLDLLAGASMQHDNKDLQTVSATDFPNDEVLEATVFAKEVKTTSSLTEYRYQAVFGRVTYNLANKYLLNLTARRDGSSRFGPDKKVANFGAAGAAWIFTEEAWLKNNLPVLSYGKLRGSYGITGNDQIGDYRYLDNYGATVMAYQGQSGYVPSRLYNGDYTWERNRKLEVGLELGWVNNRILLVTNWFRNRSDNQLIDYKLPNQTGFPSILRNFGALVQNTGWEFDLKTDNVRAKDFSWKSSFNLTLARNKLLEFPGLESSSYVTILMIGQPLNIRRLLSGTGVDAATGLYSFAGTAWPANATAIGDMTPKFYGGLSNTITYKAVELSFLFHFVKQNGPNYLNAFGTFAPGFASNQPVEVLERWTKPGDITHIQKFTSSAGAAYNAYNNFAVYSDAYITDASFIRLKNVSLAYVLPQKWIKPIGAQSLRLYFQAENLFTITGYKGLDPESGSHRLPVLRIGALGIKVQF